MLVKKINPNWTPVENNALKVGETIDITDPRALILNGDCVAVEKDGSEKGSFELYGVLAGSEKEEFEQWIAMKKQKELQEKLAEEQKVLIKEQKDLEDSQKEVKTETVQKEAKEKTGKVKGEK